MRWLLSLFFIVQMYVALAVVALGFGIPALIDRRAAFLAIHVYCHYVRWSAKVLVGLRSEVRGEVPQGEVLIASKHQSFFDIILLASALPRPKFIMKRELLYTPFIGFYGLRTGCIPVNRGKRGAAIAKMKQDVMASPVKGQLIIFPQGTRVAPGAELPYKVGAGLLYDQLEQVCIPVATNVGIFWPRHGILRKPGLAVIEFLPPIAPGLRVKEFMTQVEAVIEPASEALMREGGWTPAET
ncbi:lysophospholipid acyltransferase family protein [Stagnihabitans tardus]|uniref:1-acyl-sn-glycerol-3-phosphate acyltransferase n=1 Tax=Stagnihabitans tardus TaxID=2699202 RepID=A0AAE4Y921_9RHOB|nr:lysophospholipid acyltransferase family protein [Stagnihabitans tardus]NBZ88201.1 1-acyl-sn-glycerol-3-phosphate acyltransferase [Stagnihabitans tardus]